MGISNFFKNLYESWIIRGNKVKISAQTNSFYYDIAQNNLTAIIDAINELSEDYYTKIDEFNNMLKDGQVFAAVDSISTDASMIDAEKGVAAWVTCANDAEWENYINEFLKTDVNINDIIYAIAFNLTAYGDCYLNTFYNNNEYKKTRILGEYFEITDVRRFIHLYRFGKPSGYLLKDLKDNDMHTISESKTYDKMETILSEKDVIHFSLYNGLNTSTVTRTFRNKCGEDEDIVFSIYHGTSPVLESARKSYKTKQLLDGYLMLARLNHSQFYRLIGVETGGLDTIQSQKIIKELKNKITTAQNIDLQNQRMNTYSAPINSGAPIFYPVKNGIGALTIQDIKNDDSSNLRALLDVDRFDNQFYASLRTPKQLLGQDVEGGLLGQGPFTMLDIRYGRTVKLIQNALKEGIRKLILWKCSLDGKVPPDFDVNMTKIITAEDQQRDESYTKEIDRFNNALNFIKEIFGDLTPEKKKEIFDYAIKNIYKSEGLYNIFENESLDSENPGGDSDSFGSSDSGLSFGSDDSDSSFDLGDSSDFSFDSPSDSMSDTIEPPAANKMPEMPEMPDFSAAGPALPEE